MGEGRIFVRVPNKVPSPDSEFKMNLGWGLPSTLQLKTSQAVGESAAPQCRRNTSDRSDFGLDSVAEFSA